jgi:cytochrome c biogenesis protein CcmG/thiol:disulfide interchange protein DsbE
VRRLRWLLLPLVLVPASWLAFQSVRAEGAVSSPLIGRPMPSFALTTLDGRTLNSAELAGSPVLVNFWASWCIPACVDEHPVLIDAARRHPELAVVGILYNNSVGDARAFLVRYGDGGWPNLIDPGGRTAIDFGVLAPPETYLVDADGIVRAKYVGPLTTAALDELLAPLLTTGGAE